MRDIIFRGQILGLKEWMFGDFTTVEIDGMKYAKIGRHYVNPDTVGQYTGLTDENGKKIFEGDILDFVNEYRNQNNKWKCVVEFIDGCFVCQFIEEEGHLGDYNYFGSWNAPLVKWWVIGNRWDNPELLEGMKE